MKRIVLFLVSAFALSVFALSSPVLAAERCENCRMKVPDDSRYKVSLAFKGGGGQVVCSIYCASMVKERLGGEVTGMAVVDYLTGEGLDAGEAAWVEGSDARAVMSEGSRIAFKDEGDASAFVKEHGGRVVGFDEVYKNSVKEWKGR